MNIAKERWIQASIASGVPEEKARKEGEQKFRQALYQIYRMGEK